MKQQEIFLNERMPAKCHSKEITQLVKSTNLVNRLTNEKDN